jgi:hypothetical protein
MGRTSSGETLRRNFGNEQPESRHAPAAQPPARYGKLFRGGVRTF